MGGALGKRLGKAFTDQEIQDAIRLMGKVRNQILKDMGQEPIPTGGRLPQHERVVEVFREHRSQKGP